MELIWEKYLRRLEHFGSRIPVVQNIPGFTTVPSAITTSNLRFYKLSNLVLTLGMMIHLSWIPLFWSFGAGTMSLINCCSVIIYVYSIYLNRKGFHFTSSVIMVAEIILHQIIAVYYFGTKCGFQNYVLVIGLFPFLMPRGRWTLKMMLLGSCILTFLIFDYIAQSQIPLIMPGEREMLYLRISNIVFSFICLAVSGGYFNLAMHETEGKLEEQSQELMQEKNKTEALLLNILPEEVAQDLLQKGISEAKHFDDVSVLFTDFVDFTSIAQQLTPQELVQEIHQYFKAFDEIIERNGLEKIKTIGDAYLAVCGLPNKNSRHALQTTRAALEILDYTKKHLQRGGKFNIRIGINSGNLVAGIVGVKKFAYDIWGDTVNTAARIDQASEAGKINVSENTYQLIKQHYTCSYRGEIELKGIGHVKMYFVDDFKTEKI